MTATALRAPRRPTPPLLARLADALYWFGRYLTRGQGFARVVLAHHDSLFDLPVGAEVGWGVLLQVTGTEQLFSERHQLLLGGSQLPSPGPGENEILPFCLIDPANPSSLVSSLRGVQTNARMASAVLPLEVLAAVADLWETARQGPPQVLDRARRLAWLGRVVEASRQVEQTVGELAGADEVEVLCRLGRLVEQADLACRVLSAWADTPRFFEGPFADVHRTTLLRALHAEQPFRRAGWRLADPSAVPAFVLFEEGFPGSVRACLGGLLEAAAALPVGQGIGQAALRAVAVLDGCADAPEAASLVQAADLIRGALGDIHDQVARLCQPDPPTPPPESPRPASARARPRGTPSVMSPRRIQVLHRSTYVYEQPAQSSTTEAHLRPRATPRQRLVAYQLSVAPEPATSTPLVDPFGNHLVVFSVDEPHTTLQVVATSTVEVLPVTPPTLSPPWETVRHLLQLDRHNAVLDARRFVPGSRRAPVASALAAYAGDSFPPGRPLHEAALDLCRRIREEFAYVPGATTVSTPVEEVFASRTGVCQDFAHLAIACLRSLGLAARYVSGYVEPAGSTPVDPTTQASHAWFSVFVPGSGWLDLDPTNEPLVSDRHVTVAWGRDYDDVAPLRGTVRGGGNHRLEVAVLVESVDTP